MHSPAFSFAPRAIGALISCSLASLSHAQCLMQEVLPPDDAMLPQAFGSSLAREGEWIVVGAPTDDEIAQDAGAAYTLFRDPTTLRWIHHSKLIAGDAAAGDAFGWSVAMSDGWVAVGATAAAGNDIGSVYLFQYDSARDSWIERQKIAPKDQLNKQWFGFRVALSGSNLIVGAPTENGFAFGAVHAYRLDEEGGNWIEAGTLTPSAPHFGYGMALDVSHGWAIVGAPVAGHEHEFPGRGYVFRHDEVIGEWVLTQELVASDAFSETKLGLSVAVSDELALLGAQSLLLHRAAYVFRLNSDTGTWEEEAKLVSDLQSEWSTEWFPWTAIKDGVAAFSDRHPSPIGHYFGAVRVWLNSKGSKNWTQSAVIVQPSEAFGIDLDISENELLIADRGAIPPVADGAIFCHNLAGLDCNENSWCDEIDLLKGASVDIDLNGIPDECEKLDCTADINDSTIVDVDDLLAVINAWGNCVNPVECPADIAPPGSPPGNGVVNVDDLLAVINAWGECP